MRKLLTFLIALAAATPAYADTVTSTFDFGPAYPERIAFLMCAGRSSASKPAEPGIRAYRGPSNGAGGPSGRP
jgi:hypothetical protein